MANKTIFSILPITQAEWEEMVNKHFRNQYDDETVISMWNENNNECGKDIVEKGGNYVFGRVYEYPYITRLGLDDESIKKIAKWYSKDDLEAVIGEGEYHLEHSMVGMIKYKYEGEIDESRFDVSISTVVASGVETLGEYLLMENCLKVNCNGEEAWILFYL